MIIVFFNNWDNLVNPVFDALKLSIKQRAELIDSFVSLVDMRIEKSKSLK